MAGVGPCGVVQVRSGVGEVRAGATLLYDSDPKAEEAETELKVPPPHHTSMPHYVEGRPAQ